MEVVLAALVEAVTAHLWLPVLLLLRLMPQQLQLLLLLLGRCCGCYHQVQIVMASMQVTIATMPQNANMTAVSATVAECNGQVSCLATTQTAVRLACC